MNAVIYARFNSQNQTENSIEGQIKVCEQYAEQKGYIVTNKYIDICSREQFEQMIKDSTKKQFQYVIVYQLDRFSRNTMEQIINENKLNKNGVQLVSTQENITDDASGILLKSVIKSLVEYQSIERSNKIKAGIERKKKERIKLANEG